MDFDATSLYPSAMWDRKSVRPKMGTGVAFKLHVIKRYVEVFNVQTFNQKDNESDIIRRKYYNLFDLMFQHLPVKEKIKNIEVIRMRMGSIIDTLPSVDFQEIVKFGGKVVEIYECVTYRENFKTSPFRKVIEKLFALIQKYKDEQNDLMQRLVKKIMNILYGAQIKKDINESCCCKSEHWMQAEYDENIFDYRRLPNGNYIVKRKKDDGLDDKDCDFKKVYLPISEFFLSNSKRIMNNFIREINGYYKKKHILHRNR